MLSLRNLVFPILDRRCYTGAVVRLWGVSTIVSVYGPVRMCRRKRRLDEASIFDLLEGVIIVERSRMGSRESRDDNSNETKKGVEP